MISKLPFRRRLIWWGAIAACIAAFVTQPDFWYAAFAFVLLGIVPGTNFALPSGVMFLFYGVAVVVSLKWLMGQPIFFGSLKSQETTAKRLARQKVKKQPSRRRA